MPMLRFGLVRRSREQRSVIVSPLASPHVSVMTDEADSCDAAGAQPKSA
jgi:hypothetical protein